MTNAHTIAANVLNAANLDDLFAALRAWNASGADLVEAGFDMTALPVFGGDEPANTSGVWSWDANRMIVGASLDEARLVAR
jgi:hypothetical protein